MSGRSTRVAGNSSGSNATVVRPKENIAYAVNVAGLSKPVIKHRAGVKYKERGDWTREVIIANADRIVEYRKLLNGFRGRGNSTSRAGRLFSVFNYEFPGLCSCQGEFVALCLVVEKKKIKRLFCPICGKRNRFYNRKENNIPIWSKTCSRSCGGVISARTMVNVVRAKYNVAHVSQLESVKEKRRQTSRKHFGVDHPNQTEKGRKRLSEVKKQYILDWQEKLAALDPIVETNLDTCQKEKERILAALESLDCSQVLLSTKRPASKDINRDIFIDFCHEYHGIFVDIRTFLYVVRRIVSGQPIRDIVSDMFCPQCGKRTHLRRLDYGFTKFCGQKCAESNQRRHPTEAQQLAYPKYKHITGGSQDEVTMFLELCTYYPVVKREYKEKRYPSRCDFYIPHVDLFIEYQGNWTHGGRPFTGSEADIVKLDKWKLLSKSKSYYKSAIHDWTVADVRKREIAKANNLN